LNPKLLPQGPAAIRQYGDYSLDAVINKYRNDPDPVTDTVRARNNFLKNGYGVMSRRQHPISKIN
jgi:hypothetical protein